MNDIFVITNLEKLLINYKFIINYETNFVLYHCKSIECSNYYV